MWSNEDIRILLSDLGKPGGPCSSVFDNCAIESGTGVFPQHMFQEIPFSVLWGINTWTDVSCKSSILRLFTLCSNVTQTVTQKRFCVYRGSKISGSSASIFSLGGILETVYSLYFHPPSTTLSLHGGAGALNKPQTDCRANIQRGSIVHTHIHT